MAYVDSELEHDLKRVKSGVMVTIILFVILFVVLAAMEFSDE